MNKFQRLSCRLAKNDCEVFGNIVNFKECKGGWLQKFRSGKFTYHNALRFKNDFIKWDLMRKEE